MWMYYVDSKVLLKCKTLFYATCHISGEIFSADVDALWRLKSSLLLVEILDFMYCVTAANLLLLLKLGLY